MTKFIRGIFVLFGVLFLSVFAGVSFYFYSAYKTDGYGGLSYILNHINELAQARLSSYEKAKLSPTSYKAGEGYFSNFISLPNKTLNNVYYMKLLNRPDNILDSFTFKPSSIKNTVSPYTIKTYLLTGKEKSTVNKKLSTINNSRHSDLDLCLELCSVLSSINSENLAPLNNKDVFDLFSRFAGGNIMECHEIAYIFQYSAASLGIYTRSVCSTDNLANNTSTTKGGSHCMVEAFCRELDKWVLFDPFYNRYFVNENKEPLSALEIRNKLFKNYDMVVADRKKYPHSDEGFYYKFMHFVFGNISLLFFDDQLPAKYKPKLAITTDNPSLIYRSLKSSAATRPVIQRLFSTTKKTYFALKANFLPLGAFELYQIEGINRTNRGLHNILNTARGKELLYLLDGARVDSEAILEEKKVNSENRIFFKTRLSASVSFFVKTVPHMRYVLSLRSRNEDSASVHRIDIVTDSKKISLLRTNQKDALSKILFDSGSDGRLRVEFSGSSSARFTNFSVSSIKLLKLVDM